MVKSHLSRIIEMYMSNAKVVYIGGISRVREEGMTPLPYTSLAMSRLIHERVPEVKTEQLIGIDKDGRQCIGYDKKFTFEYPLKNFEWATTETIETYPLYRFDDLIRAIKVLGEKDRWWDGDFMPEMPMTVNDYCHKLLTAYLSSDCNLQHPAVEKVIKQIFNS